MHNDGIIVGGKHHMKGKPVERQGRKASDLRRSFAKMAGLQSRVNN